jgi:hypothetical protein
LGRFHLDLGGNDKDAFAIAEDEIAWRDPNSFDFDTNAKVDHFAARALVLRVQSSTEGRKAERLDPGRVTDEAIEHGAGGAEVARASGHKLAPKRIAKRPAGRDVDLVGAKIVERSNISPNGLAPTLPAERELSSKISASRTGMARPTTFISGLSGPMACGRNWRRHPMLSNTSPTTAVNSLSRRLANRTSSSILDITPPRVERRRDRNSPGYRAL